MLRGVELGSGFLLGGIGYGIDAVDASGCLLVHDGGVV